MSYSQMHNGRAMNPVIQEAGNERATYMAKVYSLFFTGVVVFFACAILPMIGAEMEIPVMVAIKNLSMGLPFILTFILILVFSFGASALSMTRGINLVAFYLFAAFFGWISIGLLDFAIGKAGGS